MGPRAGEENLTLPEIRSQGRPALSENRALMEDIIKMDDALQIMRLCAGIDRFRVGICVSLR